MTTQQTAGTFGAIILERSTWSALHNLTFSTKQNIPSDVSDLTRFYNDVRVALWHVVPPLLIVLGTFGNVMTVIVMREMRSSKSSAALPLFFTALAVSDECHVLWCCQWFWVSRGFSWPPSFFRFNILCSVPKFVWNVASFTSVWLLVTMTYQRVTSVVAPHRVGVLWTVRRAKFIIAGIVTLGCALHVQFLFTWVYWPEYEECQYREKYMHFAEAFEWLSMFSWSVFPFIFLVTGNAILVWHVVKSMKLSRQMRGHVEQQASSDSDRVSSITTTLILTSVAFLLLTLPVSIYDVSLQMIYLYIVDEEVSAMISVVYSVVVMLSFAAFSSNFYIYLLGGSKFREETKRHLCCQNMDHTK